MSLYFKYVVVNKVKENSSSPTRRFVNAAAILATL